METCMVWACHTRTASPKPSFKAPWRMGDAMVSRGNSGWTTIKSGHPCPCKKCSHGPPAKKTARGSQMNHPSNDPVHRGTEMISSRKDSKRISDESSLQWPSTSRDWTDLQQVTSTPVITQFSTFRRSHIQPLVSKFANYLVYMLLHRQAQTSDLRLKKKYCWWVIIWHKRGEREKHTTLTETRKEKRNRIFSGLIKR